MRFFLLAAILPTCLAQDFYWSTVSPRSLSMGGVYVPSRGSIADALATNPAGLTSMGNPTAEIVVSSIFARGSFSNAVNNRSPMTQSPGVVPIAAIAAPLGRSRFHLAAGVVPELSAVSEWRYADAPGVAGASYGSPRQKSSITAVRIAGALGVRVSDRIDIGASVGRVYNSNRLDAPYIFQRHPALQGLKTLLDLKTAGFGWNFSIGVLAHVNRKFQLGLAAKSATVIQSTGSANGNLDRQFAALGLNLQPDFRYDAQVRNELPRSLVSHFAYQATPRLLLASQMTWVNWKRSFVTLPVALSNGSNLGINTLLGSSSLNDAVPLQWKDRYSQHAGFEWALLENVKFRGGYSHAGNPVPASTLSPLTAAILRQQLTAGLGWHRHRVSSDLAYSYGFTASASNGRSALLSGEYANSVVRAGIQALTLGTSFTF